jgi:hypothetical protein
VAGAAAVAILAGALAVKVGRLTGMGAGGELAGASIGARVASNGPAMLRYLFTSLVPVNLSVVHDEDPRLAGDLLAWAAFLPLLIWAALGTRVAAR